MHNLELTAHLRNGLVRSYYSCTGSLCTIHWRTAAESYHSLAAVCYELSASLFDIFNRGVGLNTVIYGI